MFAFSQFRVYSLYCECTTFVRATTALSYYCYFTGYNFRSKRWRILNLIFERGVFFLSRDGEEPVSDFRQYYFEMILYIFFVCLVVERIRVIFCWRANRPVRMIRFEFFISICFLLFTSTLLRIACPRIQSAQRSKTNSTQWRRFIFF